MAKPKSLDNNTVRGFGSCAQQEHKRAPLIEIKDESNKQNCPAANTRSKSSKRSIEVDGNPKPSDDKIATSKSSKRSIGEDESSDGKPKGKSSKKGSIGAKGQPIPSNNKQSTSEPSKDPSIGSSVDPKPSNKKAPISKSSKRSNEEPADSMLSNNPLPTQASKRRKTKNQKSPSPDTKELYEDFHRQDLVRQRGPNGPPVFDTQGFELDYKLLSRPNRRKRTYAQEESFMARCKKGDECKERILKIDPMRYSPQSGSIVRERVARDLGMQYHEVGLVTLEERNRRGFQLEEDFFEKITEEDKQRVRSAIDKASEHNIKGEAELSLLDSI